MKIYISLPITGKKIEDVENTCIYASVRINRKGHEAVSPLYVSPNTDASYAEHMGNNIRALLECDAVLFMPGYYKSKGCRLEHYAGKIYKKKIYFSLEDIPGNG